MDCNTNNPEWNLRTDNRKLGEIGFRQARFNLQSPLPGGSYHRRLAGFSCWDGAYLVYKIYTFEGDAWEEKEANQLLIVMHL